MFLSCDFLRMVPPKNAFLSLRLPIFIHWTALTVTKLHMLHIGQVLISKFSQNVVLQTRMFVCRTRFECSSPNQGGDNVTSLYVIWDEHNLESLFGFLIKFQNEYFWQNVARQIWWTNIFDSILRVIVNGMFMTIFWKWLQFGIMIQN